MNAEQKMEQRLRKAFPLYDFIGLKVLALGDEVKFSIPLSQNNKNHLGSMHAGILFSLGEITGGIAVTQYKALSNATIVARRGEIEYVSIGREEISATASMNQVLLTKIASEIAHVGKSNFPIAVALENSDGRLVCNMQIEFQLRTSASGTI